LDEHLAELRAWERELLAHEAELAQHLEPLLVRRDAVRAKLELVRRLIRLEDAAEDAPPGRPVSTVNGSSSTVADRLLEAVESVLEESGHAMHIRDIRAALARRGVQIPGRGTDANLIVHLRRSARFVRRSRGTYALAGTATQQDRVVA
jgi:hypothetical protein